MLPRISFYNKLITISLSITANVVNVMLIMVFKQIGPLIGLGLSLGLGLRLSLGLALVLGLVVGLEFGLNLRLGFIFMFSVRLGLGCDGVREAFLSLKMIIVDIVIVVMIENSIVQTMVLPVITIVLSGH